MDALFQALTDVSRRTLLETLRDKPASANELAAILPIARPGVSRHLRVLREAGLVEVRKEAQRRIYQLRFEPIAEMDAYLSTYLEVWRKRMRALHDEIARGKQNERKTK